jgi:hypothetical protein
MEYVHFMRRKPWKYNGCRIAPQSGRPTYFGSPRGAYLRFWWRIDFPDGTWIRAATKQAAKQYIDSYAPSLFRRGYLAANDHS